MSDQDRQGGRQNGQQNGQQSDRQDLEWKEVSRKTLVDNEWINFRESVWQFPDGSSLGPFYSYTRRDYVVIVARDTEGRYLLVRQFRQGICKVTNEFPAGGIEDGEDPLEAAKRELLEETGYQAGKWTFLSRVPSAATIADNYASLYLAEDCVKTGEQHLDSTEFADVCLVDDGELRKMIFSGEFEQAMHIAACYMAKDCSARIET